VKKTKDLLRDELIGLPAEIVGSRNPDDIGAKGMIVDETKNTITIASEKKKRRYWKNNITIATTYQGQDVRVEGRLLVGRPHERIKR